mmetsp:Transcript_50434/g.98654  ORF Transcript_50434/g.98654 Transcript_50434/m.98654 type:complete len:207 (-) Transcript_50434:19-639(-)
MARARAIALSTGPGPNLGCSDREGGDAASAVAAPCCSIRPEEVTTFPDPSTSASFPLVALVSTCPPRSIRSPSRAESRCGGGGGKGTGRRGREAVPAPPEATAVWETWGTGRKGGRDRGPGEGDRLRLGGEGEGEDPKKLAPSSASNILSGSVKCRPRISILFTIRPGYFLLSCLISLLLSTHDVFACLFLNHHLLLYLYFWSSRT